MSPLEITILISLGVGLTIFITVSLVKYFKKKKNKKTEDDDWLEIHLWKETRQWNTQT